MLGGKPRNDRPQGHTSGIEGLEKTHGRGLLLSGDRLNGQAHQKREDQADPDSVDGLDDIEDPQAANERDEEDGARDQEKSREDDGTFGKQATDIGPGKERGQGIRKHITKEEKAEVSFGSSDLLGPDRGKSVVGREVGELEEKTNHGRQEEHTISPHEEKLLEERTCRALFRSAVRRFR